MTTAVEISVIVIAATCVILVAAAVFAAGAAWRVASQVRDVVRATHGKIVPLADESRRIMDQVERTLTTVEATHTALRAAATAAYKVADAALAISRDVVRPMAAGVTAALGALFGRRPRRGDGPGAGPARSPDRAAHTTEPPPRGRPTPHGDARRRRGLSNERRYSRRNSLFDTIGALT